MRYYSPCSRIDIISVGVTIYSRAGKMCIRDRAWVRMTALIGYRKKKHTWGHIERQKIKIK